MAKQEWREGVQKHKADIPGPLYLDGRLDETNFLTQKKPSDLFKLG